jgi:hypothetical protein
MTRVCSSDMPHRTPGNATALSFSLFSVEDFEAEGLARAVLDRVLATPAVLRPSRMTSPGQADVALDPGAIGRGLDAWLDGRRRRDAPRWRKPVWVLEGGGAAFYVASWEKACPSELRAFERALDDRAKRQRERMLVMGARPEGGISGAHVRPGFACISGRVDRALAEREPQAWSAWLSLVGDLAHAVRPVYGEIRARTEKDLPIDLEARLPEIPWLSIYGPPYVEMFGVERLASAPFLRVEEREPGYFWAFLSGSVFEEPAQASRAAVRVHLGEDAFANGRHWPQRPGRTPRFDLSNMLMPD